MWLLIQIIFESIWCNIKSVYCILFGHKYIKHKSGKYRGLNKCSRCGKIE